MAYTDKSKIENYLLIDIDSSFDTQIAEWCDAVTSLIDRYCNRSWITVEGGVRYFDGNGEREIKIDDFTTLSEVKTLLADQTDDQTLTENSDFVTYPYNTLPKWKLILLPNATIGAFHDGVKRLKVTADWNTSTPPAEVVLAATMLASSIVEKGLKGGEVQSESLGDYSVSFASSDTIEKNLQVKNILDSYKIWEL